MFIDNCEVLFATPPPGKTQLIYAIEFRFEKFIEIKYFITEFDTVFVKFFYEPKTAISS